MQYSPGSLLNRPPAPSAGRGGAGRGCTIVHLQVAPSTLVYVRGASRELRSAQQEEPYAMALSGDPVRV